MHAATGSVAYTGTNAMQHEMQARAARYELHVPVEFLCDGRIILGQCLNISDSGVLAEFEEPLDLWTTGELRVHAGLRSCKLTARVSRVEDGHAGLTFRNTAGENTSTTCAVIQDLITEARERGGAILPPF